MDDVVEGGGHLGILSMVAVDSRRLLIETLAIRR
jgi:hypothetical protein